MRVTRSKRTRVERSFSFLIISPRIGKRLIFDTVEKLRRDIVSRACRWSKIEDSCDRKKRDTIDLADKEDVRILRDVSRCIDDYRSSGSDISFRAVTSTGLTSSRSNFYGIPRDSFYNVEQFPARY